MILLCSESFENAYLIILVRQVRLLKPFEHAIGDRQPNVAVDGGDSIHLFIRPLSPNYNRRTIELQSKNYNRIPIQMACLVVPPGRARRVEEELVEQLRGELLRRLRREDAGLEQRRPVGLGRREDLDHAREVRRDLT